MIPFTGETDCWVSLIFNVLTLWCSVFRLGFWPTRMCPNFLTTVVPNAVTVHLCALNITTIQY